VSEVSGVGQGEVAQTTRAEPPGKGTAAGEQVSGRDTIQPPPQPLSPSFQVVSDPAGLSAVAAALDNTARVGLDVETTGLDPRTDRVRLLSLACDTIDGGTFVYLVDCLAADPSPLWEALAAKELVIHNAAFDLRFLARLGFTPAGAVQDTMLLARLLAAGTKDRCRLEDCCERYLGRTLDKAAQRSDWSSGELAADQLAYAAADVEVLVLLFQTLAEKIKAADLERVAGIEERALPAFVWLGRCGVVFDRQAWDALTQEAQTAAQQLATQLDDAAPQRPGFLTREGAWDWNSPQQVKAAFEGAGIRLTPWPDWTTRWPPCSAIIGQRRSALPPTAPTGASTLPRTGVFTRTGTSWAM
jgi:DNA polymerase III epsilon subunit-like protein